MNGAAPGAAAAPPVPRRGPLRRIVHDFWNSDRGLWFLFVALLLALFASPAFVAEGLWPPNANDAIYVIVVITGLMNAARGWIAASFSIVVGVAAVFVRLAHRFGGDLSPRLLDIAFTAGILLVLAALVMRQVFRPGRMTVSRIVGAISVYLLVGATFAELYSIAVEVHPDAIRGLAPDLPLLARSRALQYFSFTTLTTVGYGDLVPAGMIIRSLANLESLVGVLYPAVLISRLVAMQGKEVS